MTLPLRLVVTATPSLVKALAGGAGFFTRSKGPAVGAIRRPFCFVGARVGGLVRPFVRNNPALALFGS
jgi:hypothetical protein